AAPIAARAVVVHHAVVEGQDGRVHRARRALGVDDPAAGGDQAGPGRGVAVHLGLVERHRSVVHDPRAAGKAGGVVIHLAAVQDGTAPVGAAAGRDRRAFPRCRGGGVAVDLALAQHQVAGARRDAAVAVPAGDAAPVQRGVAVHLAAVKGDRAEQVLDAAAAGVGGGVAVHLAVVEGQHAAGAGEAEVIAVGDSAADKPLRGVIGHLAAVEGHCAQDIDDAAAAQGVVVLRAEGLAVAGHRTVVQGELGGAGGVEGGAVDAPARLGGGVAGYLAVVQGDRAPGT